MTDLAALMSTSSSSNWADAGDMDYDDLSSVESRTREPSVTADAPPSPKETSEAPTDFNRGNSRDGGGGGGRSRRRHEPLPIPERPPWRAHCRNLEFGVWEQDLADFFDDAKFHIRDITLPRNHNRKNSNAGYAYIEFEEKEGLLHALELNEKELFGRRMYIEVAPPRKGRDRRNNRGGGRNGNRRGGDRDFGGDKNAPPAERPKLKLKPRSKPLDAPQADTSGGKGDPFGGARTREQVLADRKKKEEERKKRAAEGGDAAEGADDWRARKAEPKKDDRSHGGNRRRNNNNSNRRGGSGRGGSRMSSFSGRGRGRGGRKGGRAGNSNQTTPAQRKTEKEPVPAAVVNPFALLDEVDE